MRKILLAVFCCILSTLVFGQGAPASTVTIKGIVIDSANNAPQGFVRVDLQDAKTKAPVRSNLTKDNGGFELVAPANGTYQLVVVFIGYKNKIIDIKGKGPVIDLGKIKLQASTKQLAEIAVTAVKPLMEQQVDRIAYNVSADPEAKAIDALDMMRKVPLLTVDANDNIQLKGSGNYKILVNGKESALFAHNPADVLRSMPATNIVRIEVITTPPAKYDAEGLAGIINIITTKNVDQGYNVNINTRYNTVWGTGLNLNPTIKVGKFGFSGYMGLGNQNRASNPYHNSETFLADQSVLTQTGNSSFDGNYKYFSGEFSYEIDTLNLLTASIDYNSNNNNQDVSGLTQTILNNNIIQQYYQNNPNTNNGSGVDAAINYQLGFKKSKDQLLTLSYQYNNSPGTVNSSTLFTDTIKYPFPNFRQYNNSGNRTQTVQVDYAQPFKYISLEAGVKGIFRNNYSNFNEDTLDNQTYDYVLNPELTNDFNYHQNVYSAYNSYQLKLDKWTGKAGLRVEETTVDANFAAGNPPINSNYSNLIPSVYLQREFKGSSLSFGFTQRIQRPDITQLNPYADSSNPQFVSTGNPNLKPELNNVFELNYSRFTSGSINAGLSYSFSNNSIQNISTPGTAEIDGTTQNITYTTYENLGSNRTLGLTLNINYPITPELQFVVNGLLNKVWLAGYYSGTEYHNSGYFSNMFTNIGYKFDNGYRIGVNTGFFTGQVSLQGKSSYFIFNQYVISKELLNKKASISFVANNPWSRYWDHTNTTTTPDFYQVNNFEGIYRTFAIRLNYKFGKLKSDIKKNQHGFENDDTKGGGKSSNGNQ
jgi:outer membrane receptor protein involved in Fe transport